MTYNVLILRLQIFKSTDPEQAQHSLMCWEIEVILCHIILEKREAGAAPALRTILSALT